jgi:spore germination cell wall hydrolase CwlJ-like protein
MLNLIITILLTFPLNPTQCATVDATRLANTIYAEARGEAAEGQIAVAWTVRNRVDSRVTWWGTDYQSVLDMPYQFNSEPITTPALCEIAEGVISGTIEDNTNGATHFHNQTVSPNWPRLRMVAEIGNHLFYRR